LHEKYIDARLPAHIWPRQIALIIVGGGAVNPILSAAASMDFLIMTKDSTVIEEDII